MTTPEQPGRLVSAEVAERVDTAGDRAAALALRAASLRAQVLPRPTAAPATTSAEQDRLLAAQETAARFYREQLDGPDGAGPRRWLAGQGVPMDGRWVLGYAPGRPTALVNELRRTGFTDVEILASGLASTGRGGHLVDRFQDRVMVGVREHRPPHAVVSFVGYAPPGADASVAPVLHGPATAIHRPADVLVGLAEQPERSGRPVVVAATALEAIARSATAGEDAPVVVAPCGPTLTPGQVAVLTEQTEVTAGVTVAIAAGDAGRRAAERAYHLLAPAVQTHPDGAGALRAVGPRPQDQPRPLLEAVITARVDWAARTYQTPAGRAGVARSARSMLRYQVGASGVDIAALETYVAQRLDPAPVATDLPPASPALDVPAPAPAVLDGAAAAHAPPVVDQGEADTADTPTADDQDDQGAEETNEPLRGAGPEALADVPAPEVRDHSGPEQLLLDFGGAGSDGDRAADPGVGRAGPAGRGVPRQAGSAERGEADGRGRDSARADPRRPGDGRPAAPAVDRADDASGRSGVDAAGRGSERPVVAAGSGGRGRPGRRGRPGDASPVAGPAAAGAVEPSDAGPATVDPAPAAAVVDAVESFRPAGQQDLAPAGEMAKLRANLAALRTLREIQAAGRPATAQEQAVLARWASWGAVPGVFESRTNHPDFARLAEQRAELRELLSPAEYAAAELTTINAHYTDLAYVRAIWDAVRELGFDGGTVLEPGCGSGNFIGLAPDTARMVGVELDPVTAGIAAALYPHAEIRTESFADTRAPSGAFDLAVGNVPFAKMPLVDRRHNPARHSMHNHFIIKSLHLTRPGGLVAVLTSRFTMDARHPAARREMAALADLVAAVRLPSNAHRAAAGTQAITDLLILRRREPDRDPAPMTWEKTRQLDLDTDAEQPDHINDYFADRPERVLGEMILTRGMNRDGELVVRATGDTAEDLARVLRDVVDEARREGLTMTARAEQDLPQAPLAVLAPHWRAEGHIEALDDGTFTTVADGQVVPHEAPAPQADELRALLGLRDTVTALLSAEAATVDDGDEHGGPAREGSPAALRAQLNDRYDAYVAVYGPLNRYTLRPTGRLDPETGEPKMARINPPMGKFRQVDPHAATVFALEHFDDANQTATKADIFARRVILPRAPQLGADTPADALAICVDTHGEVRLPEVARLLGVSEPEARAALGDLVYDEPASGRLVEAPEYLSGNVRVKLRDAQAATEADQRFETNVRALQRVIPRDLGPGEIDAAFGAPFLPAPIVEQFLQETLRDPGLRVEHNGGSDWRVRGSRSGVLSRSTWGTPGMAAPDLVQRLLTKTPIRVFVEIEDGKRALDVEATAAAQAKAIELEERFGAWVWEDPDRAEQVATRYNEMFNATVPRSYVGVTRSLPGIAVGFTPRPHQVEAVARIVAEPAVGLFHAVGAGKTAVMAISAMEQRRLGLVNKPAIVVPNHMLEQFSREFLQIYPRARLLAAGRDDMSTDRRRRFVARCATGDWDAIIMAASFFERLSLSPDEQRRFLDDELEELRDKIVRAGERAIADGESTRQSSSVKRLQKALLRKEQRIKEKLDKVKDPGVTFEQTGIDFVYRDELHELKNDTITSSIPDAGNDGSDRAVDFRMKLSYLRRERGMRVVCGATATPIANSVRELYVVTRQLRPDLLTATGTTDFDTWASTFAKVVTAIEVSPTGQGFQMRTRLAKYANVPELSLMMRTYGDVRTPEDLALPTPVLTQREDGERAPHIVTLDPAPELVDFISGLDKRVEDIRNRRIDPTVDNMLKVSGEARAASLDLRLIGVHQDTPGKIDAAAQRIAAIWRDTRDTVYLVNPDADTPVPHPTPGALQLVFCDQSTPNPEKWNAYDALADLLVDQGMPREKIRYIHEADTDAKKASLFSACRTGDVAVLIGSTAKMGVGTNVQARAIALHHLDCPWRPADVTQREGRILRQGNQNREVNIFRYVVAGSFDAFSWQTVARKGTFIDQIMRGTSAREIEDVSDETLQAHQIKAIATGNPLLMDREEVAQDLTRLERADRAHHHTQASLRRQIGELKAWITKDTRRVDVLDDAIARRRDTRGDKFAMTVAGHPFTKRAEAGRALQLALTATGQGVASTDQREATGVAELGGFRVDAVFWAGRDGMLVALRFDGIPDSSTTVGFTAAVEGDPTGLVRRLENQLADLDGARATVQARIASQQQEIARATEQLDQPFPRRDELLDARRRLRAINAVMDLMAHPPQPASAAPPAVPVTVAEWMPAEVRESLTPDEQTWLDRRIQHVAADRVVQDAARTTNLPAFAAPFDKALTHALADPGNPEMAVAVMLRCDDPAWRQQLYTVAGQAVHKAVHDAPPPPSTPAVPVEHRSEPDQPQVVDPLAPAAIVAATTQHDRALLDACGKEAVRVDQVQAAARAGDEAAFGPAFAAAMTTAIGQLDDPADVARLADLHGDEAFRAGLAHLVWTKLIPVPTSQARVSDSRTADAAAVAATAFVPITRAVPTSSTVLPAPATVHHATIDQDHAR
ncbi:helicase [Micromonospora noduli]|uniref:Helicase ATP-binding domain-containing protein n=1 Tax=Micromonospora noduli TaxID=709876 RepID=A0A328N5C7_9ACTN|nr:helicase [Micromonospora noduli]RAO03070.1 hypothetical protein LAH08_02080 [Micromonospora noduli]